MRILFALSIFISTALYAENHGAKERPTGSVHPVQIINEAYEKLWSEKKIPVSDPATDEAFLRRASLDMIGRIPTLEELTWFKALPAEHRRAKLCDKLADDVEMAPYWAGQWSSWLYETDPRLEEGRSKEWLEKKFSTPEVGWDEIVKEMLTAQYKPAEPETTAPNGASGFISSLRGDSLNSSRMGAFSMEPALNNTMRAFLAARVECAQCHDHPFDGRFKQQTYWDLDSFFRQTSYMDNRLTDSKDLNALGFIYYSTNSGMQKPAYPRLPTGELWDPKGTRTRREMLSDYVTNHENFARAYINRIWHSFFGEGLVSGSPDEINEESEVYQPQLLDALSKAFKDAHYRPREVLRWVCKSRPYGLSAQSKGDSLPHSLAHFAVRKMNPVQLVNSLQVSLDLDEYERSNLRTELFQQRSEDGEMSLVPDDATVRALMNSASIQNRIQTWVSKTVNDSPDLLIPYFQTFLGRSPTAPERKAFEEATKTRAGLEDIVGVLLPSGEFSINH